jgi:hypothetical protein
VFKEGRAIIVKNSYDDHRFNNIIDLDTTLPVGWIPIRNKKGDIKGIIEFVN